MDEGPTPTTENPAEPASRPFAGMKRLPLVGAFLVVAGGFLFATAEMAYTNLAGATDPASYSWVFDLQGLGFVLVGLGLGLAFVALGPGAIRLGGVVALVGGVVEGAGYLAFGAQGGQASAMDLLWTNQLEAVGFFLLTLGLMLGLAGLSILGTNHTPRLRRRRWGF